jgi:hypothetical protein
MWESLTISDNATHVETLTALEKCLRILYKLITIKNKKLARLAELGGSQHGGSYNKPSTHDHYTQKLINLLKKEIVQLSPHGSTNKSSSLAGGYDANGGNGHFGSYGNQNQLFNSNVFNVAQLQELIVKVVVQCKSLFLEIKSINSKIKKLENKAALGAASGASPSDSSSSSDSDSPLASASVASPQEPVAAATNIKKI